MLLRKLLNTLTKPPRLVITPGSRPPLLGRPHQDNRSESKTASIILMEV